RRRSQPWTNTHQISECTQNAARTSCDKPLHVKKIKKQHTTTPEALSSILKHSSRQCNCRRNHPTIAPADALQLCMNPSVWLAGPGENRVVLTTVCECTLSASP
ncbi:hypothetical protein FQN60_011998, partial [Etheostoma spectabile]